MQRRFAAGEHDFAHVYATVGQGVEQVLDRRQIQPVAGLLLPFVVAVGAARGTGIGQQETKLEVHVVLSVGRIAMDAVSFRQSTWRDAASLWAGWRWTMGGRRHPEIAGTKAMAKQACRNGNSTDCGELLSESGRARQNAQGGAYADERLSGGLAEGRVAKFVRLTVTKVADAVSDQTLSDSIRVMFSNGSWIL